MSRERLEEHRRLWAHKPILARIYGVWFETLLREAPMGAAVLEIGAGPGFLSDHARRRREDLRWLATDVTETSWNDLVADAHCLPLRSRSVDVVLGLDVIHHLAHPGRFLAEASRVLRPRGRMALLEPWVTPLSYPLYRWFHQEGCDLEIDPWDPFLEKREGKDVFEGNAAVLWKILNTTKANGWCELGLSQPALRVINGFAYILSLGFRKASLLPAPLTGAFLWLDRVTEPLSSLLGLRALAVWERLDDAGSRV